MDNLIININILINNKINFSLGLGMKILIVPEVNPMLDMNAADPLNV